MELFTNEDFYDLESEGGEQRVWTPSLAAFFRLDNALQWVLTPN